MAIEPRRILIVDDNPEIRKILVAALTRRGLGVDQAQGGEEAMAMLRAHRYTVVLLDLLMPRVDGFAVLDAIDQDVEPPPIVLVLTAADAGAIARLETRKIHGVIRQPFDPLEIANIVADCADLRGRSPFEAMAVAAMVGGAPLIAWLGRM